MCLAIPMQVLRPEANGAWCLDRDGSEVWVDTVLTGPVEVGQWLLSFLGAAREIVSAQEAAQVEAALQALEGVLAGDLSAIESAFADLIDREPTLPDFLKGQP